jgi:hypothetical protein
MRLAIVGELNGLVFLRDSKNTKHSRFARQPFAIHFRQTFLGHYTELENEAPQLEIAFRAMILRTLFRPGRFQLFWLATCNLFFG